MKLASIGTLARLHTLKNKAGENNETSNRPTFSGELRVIIVLTVHQ